MNFVISQEHPVVFTWAGRIMDSLVLSMPVRQYQACAESPILNNIDWTGQSSSLDKSI